MGPRIREDKRGRGGLLRQRDSLASLRHVQNEMWGTLAAFRMTFG